jgi:hypothetical protein
LLRLTAAYGVGADLLTSRRPSTPCPCMHGPRLPRRTSSA